MKDLVSSHATNYSSSPSLPAAGTCAPTSERKNRGARRPAVAVNQSLFISFTAHKNVTIGILFFVIGCYTSYNKLEV